ncbi:10677_t:CDS:2 [Ambispora gerdemannii]|uniref:Ceramide very long chain fatty acid hydroxylase n=1 Tax=Ambispora gerdemannii TaxID=144530 RepID=A0A9N8VNV3_9GLOM|nr:10677_t:CDS:2 [Ambispora gerdemannii]
MPGRMAPRYTREEVAKHNTPSDLWVISNNKVYELTEFVLDHPGGSDLIEQWAGKDVTSIMSDPDQHEHTQIAYDVLKELCIGEVVVESTSNGFTRTSTFEESASQVTTEALNQVMSNNNSYQTTIVEEANGQAGTLLSNEKLVIDETFKPSETNINTDLQQEHFLDLNKPLFYQMFHCNYSKEFYLKQIHKPRFLPYSARLFGHPHLEMLTKTPWYVIPALWLPATYYHIYMASETLGNKSITVLFIIGIFLWTLIEYTLHRFIFHIDQLLPDHPYALSVHFALHGIHHYLPMDRLRLVMPPVLGMSIATPIVRLGYMIFPEYIAHGIIAGAFFGYICYDLTHYHLHHARPFGHHLREMKSYHLNHHYKNYESGYGITSKIWDRVFGTEIQLGP